MSRTSDVAGRKVLLVDAVYTTGTTASECVRVLRKAGAAQVSVATVASTLKLAANYREVEPDDAPGISGEDQEVPIGKAIGI